MKGIKDRGHATLSRRRDSGEEECPGGQRGSVTTEAAIALPVFLCVIISVAFLIKVVYTHELIQHAITGTAHEMAAASYIYNISGLRDMHDAIRDNVKSRSESFDEHISNMFAAFESIGDFGEFLKDTEEIASEPLELIKDAACKMADGEFENMKNEVFVPLARLCMRKYLSEGSLGDSGDMDRMLKSLNIVDGYRGLDFSRSGFFEDEDNNIEIIVVYRIALPVPIKILPDIVIRQRAVVKAWLDGDGSYEPNMDSSSEEDIWSLDNFTRGRRIRALFGANLPASFPVIASFQSGKAVMIKSMDLTAESYRDAPAVEEKLDEYMGKLRKFTGQEEPWGSKGVVIRGKDILTKELLLVIPKNPPEPEIRAALERCKARAQALGIILRIEEYGYKKVTEASGEVDKPGDADAFQDIEPSS